MKKQNYNANIQKTEGTEITQLGETSKSNKEITDEERGWEK